MRKNEDLEKESNKYDLKEIKDNITLQEKS